MIIDINDFDLIKGITRTEAKKVHKDLPDGGAWRTIKGHHVYIKDGKILAGSIPGVTKAKKMTKATMAEHQATIDKDAKKGTKKNGDKKPSTPAGKATKPAVKKSGAGAKGTGGASKSKVSGSGKASDKAVKAPAKKGKTDATKKVGAKSDDKPTAKPTAKSSTTGRPIQTNGAKKGASKPDTDIQTKTAAEAGRGLDDHYEAYHGTKLYNINDIKEKGFKLNGSEDDFGDAAYFKSPSFDHKDDADFKGWLDYRRSVGAAIPKAYENASKYDTVNIAGGFAGKGSESAVVKALIPKKHVLDCSNGRPKELQELIDDYKNSMGSMGRVRLAFKHLLGENLDHKTDAQVSQLYNERKDELKKAWGGDKFIAGKVSPYELYAKRTGVKAIVDKLDHYDDEGWQIGVYDPSIIKIHDVGKGIARDSEGVKLLKALLKALAKAKASGYCLLHHEIDDEGLHLHVGALAGEEMEKSLTRKDAKAVHKELPSGGEWRTIKGHHIYIKDGKVLAGSIPGVTKAKKATKAQLAEHQATIDKEKKPAKKAPAKPKAKAGKKDDTKVPKKPEKTTTGKKRGSTAKPSPDNTKPAPATKKPTGAKKAPKAASKPKEVAPKAKAKDIRSDAQKNRELAYDVGDKVGGARKDEFIASFKEKPTAKNLEELEKMSGAVAEKMVTKANLLPKFDFQGEHDSGVDLPTAILKKLIQDRIAPKPEPSNPETRKAYMLAMSKVQRHFGGIKSFENMRDALREMSTAARQVKAGKDAESALARYEANPERWSYFNGDSYKERAKTGKEAAKFMDFDALGEKFNNLLTNYESLNRSIDTVRKNTKEGWDKYLTPQAKAAPKKKGEENKRWEREAVAEHLRKGGKETKVQKPEDLMKEFNLRGVEFGNWVNDSSGLFHLKRSAEAFDDLADIIGVDKKDISLNGRLAIAFGARGKGGALAHYEPDRKVINMTKHGGAGSLAHEWGHAMDNILYQYSHNGQESLGLASQGQMGNSDPKLNMLYDHLMSTITEPQDGVGHVKKVEVDSEDNPAKGYYPSMLRIIKDNPNEEGLKQAKLWSYDHIRKTQEQIATQTELVKRADSDYSRKHREKALKKLNSDLKTFKRDFPHMIAYCMKHATGKPYKGTVEVPTGTTEYLNRMEETNPGKTQNGSHYWSAPEEMFARVFESYVQDKMKKAKRDNNYLVHGTSEGAVKAMGAPFPIGKERETMHKAMENLLKYVGSKGTLKKALILELLASGTGNMTEELRKSLGYTKRSAYNVANPEECIYIPLNRLRTVYQTEKATNWDKVQSNFERMQAGENLEPVSIGLDYDVHDGHHRIEAAKKCGHEHIPCIVKGGNDLERERAVDAYREVWKSIMKDPTSDNGRLPLMFRGVGLREMKNIQKTGFIQSKGKGNDEDKDTDTCFSNLYSQAEGYARSNYDLYNEHQAFVLVVHNQGDADEDEHGEMIAHKPVPKDRILEIVPIPKPQ
jgi:hypothetical protein